MTGPEHYRRAQDLMAAVTQETHYGAAVVANPDMAVIAAAQVHATLAVAAATALSDLHPEGGMPLADHQAWYAAAGVNREKQS